MRTTSKHHITLTSLALASALFAASARPAAAAPTDAQRAEALFTSGKDAMARGDLATACARLDESQRLDPAVGTLLNLATCLERSGRHAAALERFVAARGQLAKDDFRVAFTTEHIDALSKRVGRLAVEVVGTRPSDARVLRDGVEVAPASLASPAAVDPGAHTVVLESGGRVVASSDVQVAAGESQVVELHVGDRARPSTPVVPRRVDDRDADIERARTLGWVTGGIGVAGLVTGTVTGIVALGAAGTYRADCVEGECGPDGLAAASTGRAMSVVSPVAFAIGLLGVGASAYFFLGPPSRGKPVVGVAPSITPWGGGLSVSRSF